MKGLIFGAVIATGVSIIDGKSEKIITNALIGGAAGYFLLMYLNKIMK
jgi:hypothetical protein